MNALNFETGIVTYSINGKHEVHFNPTDYNMIERLFDTIETLDERQERYSAELEAAQDNRAAFEVVRKVDAEMRAEIDKVLGEGVADGVFEGMNVCALAGGMPVWANLLLALYDVIQSVTEREVKTTSPRVQKYTQRYAKK